MRFRNVLLGTTAVIGAGMLVGGTANTASAAEVKAGGYPDITITGFLRAEAGGGEQDDFNGDPDKARGLDFRNDTEVHVLARAKSEQTGLEYGATVEFEADTNQTFNTDETWMFLRGGWGELRMGDEDGVADNSSLGAQTIAAGTGGIDGSSFVAGPEPYVFITNTNDATKIRYYTPTFAGFSAGVSYTPTQNVVGSGVANGDNIANKGGVAAMQGENIVEGGLVYDGEFGGVGIMASVVGLYGQLKNGGEDAFGDDKWQGGQAGAVVDLFGFKLAGSYGYNEVGEQKNQFVTAGIGYGFGPVNTSVTYARLIDTNSDYEEATGFGDAAQNLVFSADIALAPGLVLAGDVGVFDQDFAGDTGTGDQGWVAVGRFAVAF